MKLYAAYSGIFMHSFFYLHVSGFCFGLKKVYFPDKKKVK